jgi:hypothetical protein
MTHDATASRRIVCATRGQLYIWGVLSRGEKQGMGQSSRDRRAGRTTTGTVSTQYSHPSAPAENHRKVAASAGRKWQPRGLSRPLSSTRRSGGRLGALVECAAVGGGGGHGDLRLENEWMQWWWKSWRRWAGGGGGSGSQHSGGGGSDRAFPLYCSSPNGMS